MKKSYPNETKVDLIYTFLSLQTIKIYLKYQIKSKNAGLYTFLQLVESSLEFVIIF